MSQSSTPSSKVLPLFARRFAHTDGPTTRRYNTFLELRFGPSGNPEMSTIKIDRFPVGTAKADIPAVKRSFILAYEIPTRIASHIVTILTARVDGRNDGNLLTPTEVLRLRNQLESHPSWTQDGVRDLFSLLSQFRQDADVASWVSPEREPFWQSRAHGDREALLRVIRSGVSVPDGDDRLADLEKEIQEAQAADTRRRAEILAFGEELRRRWREAGLDVVESDE